MRDINMSITIQHQKIMQQLLDAFNIDYENQKIRSFLIRGDVFDGITVDVELIVEEFEKEKFVNKSFKLVELDDLSDQNG